MSSLLPCPCATRAGGGHLRHGGRHRRCFQVRPPFALACVRASRGDDRQECGPRRAHLCSGPLRREPSGSRWRAMLEAPRGARPAWLLCTRPLPVVLASVSARSIVARQSEPPNVFALACAHRTIALPHASRRWRHRRTAVRCAAWRTVAPPWVPAPRPQHGSSSLCGAHFGVAGRAPAAPLPVLAPCITSQMTDGATPSLPLR